LLPNFFKYAWSFIKIEYWQPVIYGKSRNKFRDNVTFYGYTSYTPPDLEHFFNEHADNHREINSVVALRIWLEFLYKTKGFIINRFMRSKNEIAVDLENNEILPRLETLKLLQNEIAALQSTVTTLRALGNEDAPLAKENIATNELANYPGYPLQGSLIEKFAYLEDQTLKVWRMSDMLAIIQKIEGKKQSAKTLKSARQKAHYYLKNKELIRLQYGSKRAYTFFTTRPEWVEKENDGNTTTLRLLDQHEPDSILLSGLTEGQRNSISWSGIN
jgi:hypothetical protein